MGPQQRSSRNLVDTAPEPEVQSDLGIDPAIESPSPRRSPRFQEGLHAEESHCVAVRTTGLHELLMRSEQPKLAPAKPKRKKNDGAWQYVTIAEEKDSKIWVKCNFCDIRPFQVSSVTRIVDHLLGRTNVKPCVGNSDEYSAACVKLKSLEEAKDDAKRRKQMNDKVKAVSVQSSDTSQIAAPQGGGPPRASSSKDPTQMPLVWKRSSAAALDEAVARFFFGNNVSTRIVDSKTFKDFIQALRCAPLDWKPPSRQRLGGKCLEDLCKTLRREEAPLRLSVFRNGGTVLSDGWDCVDKNHLVNQLRSRKCTRHFLPRHSATLQCRSRKCRVCRPNFRRHHQYEWTPLHCPTVFGYVQCDEGGVADRGEKVFVGDGNSMWYPCAES